MPLPPSRVPSAPPGSSPACRACGSAHVTLCGKRHGHFLRREFEFHACHACGFMMVEPFSGFEIYNDAYYRGAGPDPYVDYESEYHNWRQTDRLLEFEDLARIASTYLQRLDANNSKLLPSASDSRSTPNSKSPAATNPKLKTQNPKPTPARLRWLDFGCGAGGFLKYLRERATLAGRPLELAGHDVGSYAELLETKDRFRILDPDAIAREPDAHYDVISMIEVIEHLPNPLEPLRLVSRLLKPGGLLLLTTGNLASPAARRQGIHYRYCAPEIHVSLFNPRALARLYARVGLAPYPVSYHGAVQFKVVKTLRHRPALRGLASAALALPPVVRAIDALYGVSAMPCAIKPAAPPP